MATGARAGSRTATRSPCRREMGMPVFPRRAAAWQAWPVGGARWPGTKLRGRASMPLSGFRSSVAAGWSGLWRISHNPDGRRGSPACCPALAAPIRKDEPDRYGLEPRNSALVRRAGPMCGLCGRAVRPCVLGDGGSSRILAVNGSGRPGPELPAGSCRKPFRRRMAQDGSPERLGLPGDPSGPGARRHVEMEPGRPTRRP